ncbi:TATDN1 [Symbiodinium sp. CCMP2592]|nr:TATDN1 [Symbiodinium sp. CCMP2592]
MVGAPMRAGQVMNDWDGVHAVDVTMARNCFSLGHEGLLADTAERYWREKVSKAKGKAKTKGKVEAPSAGCAQSVHHSKGRQVASCEGLRSEELDEAEQELLGPATREKLSSATARNSRRSHVDEVDESTWKHATRSREHHVSWLLAAQEQLLQRSGLCEPAKPFLAEEANGTSLMDENAARRRPGRACIGASDRQCSTWERTSELTLTLTGDFVDELARGYSQPWFQDLVRQCMEESGDQQTLLERLHDVAFEVQKPVLENWGFEGNDQGLFDMTSILREHSAHGPLWLQEKIFSCLRLLLPCQQESAVGSQQADAKKTVPFGLSDEFERRHFEGDFLGAVARAPVSAGEAVTWFPSAAFGLCPGWDLHGTNNSARCCLKPSVK